MVVRTTSHGLPLRLMMVQPIGVGKIPLPSNSSELKIHAMIEEEIFYPAVRRQLSEDVMNEADEEHHVARVLIAELDRDGRGNDHREAKFTVLAESVRHHIREEEGEMLPKAKSLDLDFEA